MGQWWPTARLGPLTVAFLGGSGIAGISPFLKEVPITAITPTIVWPQATIQGGNTAPPISRKIGLKIY